jgi:hypothetical protein
MWRSAVKLKAVSDATGPFSPKPYMMALIRLKDWQLALSARSMCFFLHQG